MKCSNPDCNRGIDLVAYGRGWFRKRRYCSKQCRDAFAAHAPKLECAQLYRVTGKRLAECGSIGSWFLIRRNKSDQTPIRTNGVEQ